MHASTPRDAVTLSLLRTECLEACLLSRSLTYAVDVGGGRGGGEDEGRGGGEQDEKDKKEQ